MSHVNNQSYLQGFYSGMLMLDWIQFYWPNGNIAGQSYYDGSGYTILRGMLAQGAGIPRLMSSEITWSVKSDGGWPEKFILRGMFELKFDSVHKIDTGFGAPHEWWTGPGMGGGWLGEIYWEQDDTSFLIPHDRPINPHVIVYNKGAAGELWGGSANHLLFKQNKSADYQAQTGSFSEHSFKPDEGVNFWGGKLFGMFCDADWTQGYGTESVTMGDGAVGYGTSVTGTILHQRSSGGTYKSGPFIQYLFSNVFNNPTTTNPRIPTGRPKPGPGPWGTSCFASDTKISMADGSHKDIKNINIGDEVLGYNTSIHETISSRVVETFKHPDTQGYMIVNDDLKVTPEHPMYDGYEWKPIGQFGIFDNIQGIDGNKKSIDKLEYCNDVITTYNLEVESEHHNYFAGSYLAHNKTVWFPTGGGGGDGKPPISPNPSQPGNPSQPTGGGGGGPHGGGGGGGGGGPSPGGGGPHGGPNPGNCFTGDTLISLSGNDTKPIKDIKCDDIVKVCNIDTNENITSKVTKTFKHPDTDGYMIINDQLKVTSNHPMYDGSNWREVKDFHVHDDIQYVDHTYKNISSIERCDETVTTYNFEVESEHHNYYADGYLVHNSKSRMPQRKSRPRQPFNCRTAGGAPGTRTGKPSCDIRTCVPIISSAPPEECGRPCIISNIPWIEGLSNEAGIPEKLTFPNNYMTPLSSMTCAVRLSIRAPIKHYGYQTGEILFWTAIDKNGQLVGLSEPRYLDPIDVDLEYFLESLPAVPLDPPVVPTSQYNRYQLTPVAIYRNPEDVARLNVALTDSSSTGDWDELTLLYMKDSVGTVDFNPVTQLFQNVNLTTHQYQSLSRTLTAASYAGTNYSMAYLPGDGAAFATPLVLSNSAQNIGWEQRGSGFTASSVFCYDVEHHPATIGLSGWDRREDQMVGTLTPKPDYRMTLTNSHPNTGMINTLRYAQGSVCMARRITRPRSRLPVATGSFTLDHHDHNQRKYDLFNWRVDNQAWRNHGYRFMFSTYGASLSSMYAITPNKWSQTNNPTLTAQRIQFEMQSDEWDIAEFTDFVHLSAQEFGLFLNTFGKFSETQPLTSHSMYLELIGFCKYNGSLSAADGNYYCAAIARGNPPTWCTPVTGISDVSPGFENFVVCTSGCNLSLPYITVAALSSSA